MFVRLCLFGLRLAEFEFVTTRRNLAALIQYAIQQQIGEDRAILCHGNPHKVIKVSLTHGYTSRGQPNKAMHKALASL